MSGKLSLDELMKLYPERTVALYRIERGAHNARRLVWVAQWYCGYFTSDSDRHVYHRSGDERDYQQQHFGDTPEEALYDLVRSELHYAKRRVEMCQETLAEAQEKLSEMADRIGTVVHD